MAFKPAQVSQTSSSPPTRVSFDRHEIRELMTLFGRMVAAGEWRDYALDFLKDRAVFSVFRRTAEQPLFQVEKNPRLANRQGLYAVTSQTGRVLKRGHDLATVLRVMEHPIRLVKP
ncbi:MAG: DUF2794 domain-containing protein [Hyphomicrobiales bacterium]